MKISRYFLTPYLIMLLIPILFEVIVFLSSTRTLRDNSVKYSFALLDRAAQTVDQRFIELDKISNLLVENIFLRHISFQENIMENVYNLYKLQKNLYDYRYINAVLEEYYIYLKKSDFILNSSIAYKYDQFYGTLLQQGMVPAEEWKKQIMRGQDKINILPAVEMRINNYSGTYLTYIKRFPYYGVHNGALVMLIDEKELIGDLGAGQELFGEFLITQKNGQVLASLGGLTAMPLGLDIPEKERGSFNWGDNIVCFLHSMDNDLIYLSIQSRQTVFEEQKRNTLLLTIIFTIILMMGVPTAFYFAMKNTESRKKIELELIREQKILANYFIGQLLSGELTGSEDEIKTQIIKMNLPLTEGFYRSVLMSLNDASDDKWSQYKLSLTGFISEKYGDWIYTFDIKEYNCLAFIIRTQDRSREFIIDILEKLEKEFQEYFHSPLRWGLGMEYREFTKIVVSLNESRSSLQYLLVNSKEKYQFFDERLKIDNYFFFPHELEQHLLYSVQSGNIERIEEIFSQIHSENFIKRHLQTSLLKQFTLTLWGTMLRVSNITLLKTASLEDEIQEINSELPHYSPGRQFDIIKDFFMKLTGYFKEKQKSGNQNLKGRLQDYILENYTNDGLSLSSIGWHLKISEVYVSQFFKEQFGENFSSYLNRLRMEKARELLKDSDHSLKEIATLVGFGSYNSFSRSFKRTHGVSAGEYRQSPDSFKDSADFKV